MRSLVRGVAHADQGQGVGHALLQLLLAFLAAEHPLHRQVNVVVAAQPGQQRVVLEHHRPLGARACDFAAIADQPALRRRQQAGDQVEQGGLAATRVTDQGDELALGNAQVDVTEGMEATLFGVEHHFGAMDVDELGHHVLLSGVWVIQN